MPTQKPSPKQISKSTALRLPPQAKDLPATQGMLQMVRSELKAEIRELRSEMKAEFNRSDAKLEHVLSEVSRLGVLVEEQNSNNRVVLEGLTGLWQLVVLRPEISDPNVR